jgi:general secretion pathway protein E
MEIQTQAQPAVTFMEPLSNLLLTQHKISFDDLEKALSIQKTSGERLGRLLVNLGYISEEELLRTTAQQLNLEYLPLVKFPTSPPINIGIPTKFMEQYKFFPLSLADGVLAIAMADPLDMVTIDALKLRTNCRIVVYISKESDIAEAIERYFGSGSSTMERIVGDIPEGELQYLHADGDEDVDHLRDMAQEAPVIRLVSLVISKAIESKASDIHIEAFENQLKVRYRIDGILYDTESPPKRLQPAIISRIKIMAEMNIAERRLPQDGRVRLRMLGKKVELRVSTIPTIYGESVVMRILDRSSIMLDLDDLGFPADSKKHFENLIRKPHGIILVTGPTGSGKTTTLYAALDKINSPDKKIITVEDPIEYQLSGVNQIQVKPKIGLTFASGLRSIVRQDPDIMMVGEIRDLETAEIAIQSALTGHLVFSTLHTNDAPGAITRLLDMGVEHYLAASCLEGILAQRLVRVVCNKCKQETEPDRQTLKLMGLKDVKELKISTGKGCKDCNFTGYRGRMGIFELLIINDEIRQLILNKTSSNVIRQHALAIGMTTLREDGWKKVRAGITSVEEVLRVTQEEDLGID